MWAIGGTKRYKESDKMAEKNILMQRKKADGSFDTYYPKTKVANLIDGFSLFTGAALSVVATNKTYSASTALDNNFFIYENLTINSGVTLTVLNKCPTIIIVKNTLTLNGNISAVGKGGIGGFGALFGTNSGGNGGGLVLIIAKKIVGNGTIDVSGKEGGTPTQTNPGDNTNEAPDDGSIGGIVLNGGGVPDKGEISSPATAIALGAGYCCPLLASDIGGAGGSYSSLDRSSPYNLGQGGGGGAGCGGSGGDGGGGGVDNGYSLPGGGGGGGGGIILISTSPVPGLSLFAKGGDGGGGYYGSTTDHGGPGGGGGGGGLITILAPSSSATVNVAGGAGGPVGRGSGTREPGDPGEAGVAQFKQIV
jgi:hypothetical protein